VDEELTAIAHSLVWWKPPEEVEFHYLVRRVMDRGMPAMVGWLEQHYGRDVFRRALEGAEPGNFSEKSWNYWHLVLDLRPTPPLPQRTVPPSPYVSTEIRRASARPAGGVAAA
jgi:hypothetical protein